MQLDKVNLSPALAQCLTEEIETCGLSPSAFKRYLEPQLNTWTTPIKLKNHNPQSINNKAKEEKSHTEDRS